MSACRTGTDLCDEPRTIDGRFEMVSGRSCSHGAPFFRQVCAQGPACTSAAAACEQSVFTSHKSVSCCNMHMTSNRRPYRHFLKPLTLRRPLFGPDSSPHAAATVLAPSMQDAPEGYLFIGDDGSEAMRSMALSQQVPERNVASAHANEVHPCALAKRRWQRCLLTGTWYTAGHLPTHMCITSVPVLSYPLKRI